MSSWRTAKVGWCTRCNCERPLRKSRGNGENAPKGSRIHVCTSCWDRVELPPKYKSTPTRSKLTGRTFMSKKEANREPVLVAMQNSGQIRDLKYQAPDFAFRIYSNGPVDALVAYIELTAIEDTLVRLVRDVQRSVVRIPGKYRPDFTYHTPDDVLHVEDPKGAQTMQYRRNKALMLACFGIEVEEPEEGGVQQRARGCGVAGRGTGSRLMGGR